MYVPLYYFLPKRRVIILLIKDFSQRRRYFSLYSVPPGSLLDEAGWYSVTPELLATPFSMLLVGMVGIRSLLRRPASEVSVICLNDMFPLLIYCFSSHRFGYLWRSFVTMHKYTALPIALSLVTSQEWL